MSDTFIAVTIVPSANIAASQANSLNVSVTYGGATNVIVPAQNVFFTLSALKPYTFYFPVNGPVAVGPGGIGGYLISIQNNMLVAATFSLYINVVQQGVVPQWLGPDIAVGTVVSAASPGTLLVPAPPGGFSYWVSTLSFSNATGALFYVVQGAVSGFQYAGGEVTLATANLPPIPLGIKTWEQLNLVSSGAFVVNGLCSFRLTL
jgi:hypothetical protein